MKRVRLPDLTLQLQPDTALLVRSTTRGVGARVPLPAVGVLAFCGVPRDEADVAAAMGPSAVPLFRGLVDAGLLVDPAEAADTPVFFQNFAAVDVHRRMLADAPRVDAYAAALREVVRPGSVVMDAGTGSGLLACLAALAGARRVYAVDRSDLVDLAREVVAASGLSDRVTVVRGDFATVDLPEPVDVIVTETFGSLALAEGSVPDLRAAVDKHLRPGGAVIPHGLDLHLAPVGDPGVFAESVDVFGSAHGVSLAPLRALALRRARSLDLRPDQLLARAATWASWRYPGPDGGGDPVRFTLAEGSLVGLAGWFTLRLSPSVALPTGPDDPVTHWGQTLLPLEPVPVRAGEVLEVDATVQPAPDDRRSVEVRGTWRVGDRGGSLFHRAR